LTDRSITVAVALARVSRFIARLRIFLVVNHPGRRSVIAPFNDHSLGRRFIHISGLAAQHRAGDAADKRASDNHPRAISASAAMVMVITARLYG
jgi:hypothetical protein